MNAFFLNEKFPIGVLLYYIKKMNLVDAEFESAHSGYYPLISVIIWGELPRKETKIPNLPMCVSTNFLLIKRPMIIQFKTKRDSLVKTEHPLISF